MFRYRVWLIRVEILDLSSHVLCFIYSCPVEPTIFPKFAQNSQSALISEYEAFRFTESYGVIFQCNVKYCLGPCPPVRTSQHCSH